jgi:hypothetical protein
MSDELSPAKVRLTDGLGPNVPERAETPLGVHWLGGVPYMLTSAPKLTPEQRARLISGGPNAGCVRRENKR